MCAADARVRDGGAERVSAAAIESMKLRAKISASKNRTQHLKLQGGVATPIEGFSFVEIVPDEGGAFLLLYLDSRGNVLADTWHASVADAKAQAEFEFGLTGDDWQST
jgi:hypothetical protein